MYYSPPLTMASIRLNDSCIIPLPLTHYRPRLHWWSHYRPRSKPCVCCPNKATLEYAYTHKHTHTYDNTTICNQTHTHRRTHTHMHTHTRTHAHTHTHTVLCLYC